MERPLNFKQDCRETDFDKTKKVLLNELITAAQRNYLGSLRDGF